MNTAGIIREHARFLADNRFSFWGSITEADEEGVALAVREAEQYDGPIVELGTMFGHTTLFLASLKQRTRELITVDNYSWNPFCLPADVHRAFTKRTLRHAIKTDNVTVFDGTTREFFAQCNAKPSLVFIDASHEYADVLDDIDGAIACGAKVIAGHDFCVEHPGVQRAVLERFGRDISVIENVWIAKPNYMGRVATQSISISEPSSSSLTSSAPANPTSARTPLIAFICATGCVLQFFGLGLN